MNATIEVRMHGRGGQGTVTLAALATDAAFRSGAHVLGFPAFGTERTGAPVAAFLRCAPDPVLDRSEVRAPSIVVVQDPTLIGVVDVLEGIREDGIVIVNSTRTLADLAAHVLTIRATEIAIRHLGKPITSTAMLGAVAATGRIFGLDEAVGAIEERFAGEMADRNIAAAREAFGALVQTGAPR